MGEKLRDSFDRPDSAGSLGYADSGHPYVYGTNTWSVVGGTAHPDVVGHTQAVASVGITDGIVEAQVIGTGYISVVGRYVDTNNRIMAQTQIGVAGFTTLQVVNAGVYGTIASWAGTVNSADRLGMKLNGTAASILVNGAIVASGVLTTAPNGSKWGLGGFDVTASLDDLVVSDLLTTPNNLYQSEALDWVTPEGDTVPLFPSTLGFYRERGTVGRFMPVFSFDERDAAQGSTLQRVRALPREVNIPVFVVDEADREVVRSTMRTLSRYMNPLKAGGIGKLRYTAPDSSVRELNCSYSGGMQAAADMDGFYHKFLLSFRAFDPFWHGEAESIDFGSGAVATAFFPLFPLKMSTSQIFGDVTIENEGDADAWPIWTITGPGTGIVIRNLLTGLIIDLSSAVLLDGQGMIVDTRPGHKTIQRSDTAGVNMYPYLTSESVLWPLASGLNSLRIEIDGVSGDSAALLQFEPRYLTP